MAATENQRAKFGKFGKPGTTTNDWMAGSWIQETRSSILRTFYMKGQHAFRTALGMGFCPQIEALNDTLQDLSPTEREGFLMGWQADAWATDRSKELSVEGTYSFMPVESYV